MIAFILFPLLRSVGFLSPARSFCRRFGLFGRTTFNNFPVLPRLKRYPSDRSGMVTAFADVLSYGEQPALAVFGEVPHPTSNLPLRVGKGWMYEGGIREPTIARVPGVTKPGSVCEQYITSPDFFPTVLDIAAIKTKPSADELDGRSFLPLLAGKPMERGPIYWHYPHYGNQGGAPGGAIRDGDLKLIEWYENGTLELFDLRADPGEKTDLAKTRPEDTAKLHKKLAAWRTEVGAIMPKPR